MIIRIKKKGVLGDVRDEARVKIDEVVVNRDFLKPEKEHVSLYFKGAGHSGIINIGLGEMDKLISSLKSKENLINKAEIIQDKEINFESEKGKKSKKISRAKKRK